MILSFKSILFTGLLILHFNLFSQQITPVAAVSNNYLLNANQQSELRGMRCDTAGNTYISLKTQGSLTVGKNNIPDLMTNKTQTPYYVIIKLNKKGIYQWGLATIHAIADFDVDPRGGLYFSINDNSDAKNSKITIYQTNNVILAEGSNNVLIKLSPEGNYLWSKKLTDYYLPRTIVKVGQDNRLYYLMTKNGTRMMDHTLFCMTLNGYEEWRSDIFNQYVDVFGCSPDGKSYIAGYDYKTDEKKVVKYPFEIGRYALLEIDESGTQKKMFDKKFDYDLSKPREDFYMNQVSFDKENNPLFVYAILFDASTPSVTIAGKKFKREDGEFLFTQVNKKGELIYSYQLKTGFNGAPKTSVPESSLGTTKSMGIYYTKNDTWIFSMQVGKSIQAKTRTYEPLGKANVVCFELEPKDKGTINWITRIKTGSLSRGVSPFAMRNDSTFYTYAQSNDSLDGVQLPYFGIVSLKVKIKKEKDKTDTGDEDSDSEQIPNDTAISNDSTAVDSTSSTNVTTETTENVTEETTETPVENTETTSENTSETTEEPAPAQDPGALKVQLMPGQGQNMMLYISKTPDDESKAAHKVTVEIRDQDNNNLFEQETELTPDKAIVNFSIATMKKGKCSINVTAGNATANLAILKI